MDDKETVRSETKPASTTYKIVMLKKTAVPQQPLTRLHGQERGPCLLRVDTGRKNWTGDTAPSKACASRLYK